MLSMVLEKTDYLMLNSKERNEERGNEVMNNFRRPSPDEVKRNKEWKEKMKKIIMDDPELSIFEKLKKIHELDSMDKIIKY